MPTAICRIFTSEGFVIAADGRKFVFSGAGRRMKEDTQKIFPLDTPGGTLAYSMGGTVGLGPDDTEEVVFSFRREIEQSARALDATRPESLYEYAGLLAMSLHRSLLAVQQRLAPFDGELDPGRRGSTIVQIFLDGYFHGEAARATIRFWHENQILPPPEVLPEWDLNVGEPVGYGSRRIFTEVFRMDTPHFAAYRKPKLMPEDVTLDYAVEMAHGYIRAFADPEAARIDPLKVAFVGGHTHIAKVTASHGFEWVIPPLGH